MSGHLSRLVTRAMARPAADGPGVLRGAGTVPFNERFLASFAARGGAPNRQHGLLVRPAPGPAADSYPAPAEGADQDLAADQRAANPAAGLASGARRDRNGAAPGGAAVSEPASRPSAARDGTGDQAAPAGRPGRRSRPARPAEPTRDTRRAPGTPRTGQSVTEPDAPASVRAPASGNRSAPRGGNRGRRAASPDRDGVDHAVTPQPPPAAPASDPAAPDPAVPHPAVPDPVVVIRPAASLAQPELPVRPVLPAPAPQPSPSGAAPASQPRVARPAGLGPAAAAAAIRAGGQPGDGPGAVTVRIGRVELIVPPPTTAPPPPPPPRPAPAPAAARGGHPNLLAGYRGYPVRGGAS
jgi:Meckel syndrome type 1 protein